MVIRIPKNLLQAVKKNKNQSSTDDDEEDDEDVDLDDITADDNWIVSSTFADLILFILLQFANQIGFGWFCFLEIWCGSVFILL